MSFICRRLKEASEISRFEADDLMSQNCLLQYVLSRELSGLASEVLHLVRKGALRRKIAAAVVFVPYFDTKTTPGMLEASLAERCEPIYTSPTH